MSESIAITGATGTLGNALVSLLLSLPTPPSRLVLISRGEARQAEMKTRFPETGPLRYFIADVRDEARLCQAFEGCDTVIHAAALKRIEVCEREPIEAMKTNVLGTLNACHAAIEVGAKRFLLVSSDKATAACTTYGATKYLAERLVSGMNNYTAQTRFSSVRYGNVLGSTGSAVHLFREAEMIPITHPDMTRFWWRPADAAAFVLSSLAIMRGGETFIPKLKAMRVTDMAAALNPQAATETIGLRGAEKLHESMVSPDESLWTAELPDRYVILPPLPFWSGWEWPEAQTLPQGWSYTSENAPRLTSGQLLEMVST